MSESAEGPATVTLTWDHLHAAACKRGNSTCSAHQPGNWQHLAVDMAARVDALTADLTATRASLNFYRDVAEANRADWGKAERVIANVRALADEWALTEFPDEPTANMLRLDLRALLPAAPTGEPSVVRGEHDTSERWL
jgi:hypothetical protein